MGFWGFRWNSGKTLRNFSVVIRWWSNLQGSCPFGCKRCANNKQGNSDQKKITFWARKRQKNGFFGVSYETPWKRFAIFQYRSDENQAYRVAAHLALKGAQIIKNTTLGEEKEVLGQNLSKKRVFWGFPMKPVFSTFFGSIRNYLLHKVAFSIVAALCASTWVAIL